MPKAAGEVELPFHIRWSGPSISYDLNDRADRARVYEQVLREGTERSGDSAASVAMGSRSTTSGTRSWATMSSAGARRPSALLVAQRIDRHEDRDIGIDL